MTPSAKELATMQARLAMQGIALVDATHAGATLPTYVLRTQRGQSWTLSSWHGIVAILGRLQEQK